MYGISIDT
jgi:ER lumen protein retaining receptor